MQVAEQYRSWLSAHPEATLADVCFTAGAGRAHFEHRAALVVNSKESASELLGALADDRPAPGLVRGVSDDTPKTAWLFTGQGSQYAGMARELFDTEPVFAETLTRCAAAVADVLEKPLLDVIFDADSPDSEETLRQTSYAQPALFAVEMGLARLWQSWGFEPDVVLGHSVGQYSAACVAGVFSLEDGALLMAERGRLFGSLPAGGRMVAVFAAAERVESLTDEFPSLSVAAYNGANTVLSGPAQDLDQAVAELTADGVRCDWLDTSHAFHSALLDPILDEFESYANGFEFGSPQRILVCNRTGAALGRSVKLDGAYWRRHARQPVEFAKSVRTLAELGCKVLLEVGPQPVLTAAALRAWPDPATAPRAIASLRRNAADHRQITEALADAYVAGPPARLRRCRRTGAKARPADLSVPASPVLVPRQSGLPQPTTERCRALPKPSGFSRTAGSRNSPRCSTVRAAPIRPLDVLTQACRTTQPAAKPQSIADAATRSAGSNPLLRSPIRKPARHLPGCSSAMMPMQFSHWSTR